MSTNAGPEGTLVIQVVAMPADTNANGDIFGGWLVSNMDMGAGIAGRNTAQCRVVTVSIDKLVFIRPVSIGDTVLCYAHLLKIGRTSMEFKMEAWIQTFQENKPFKVAEGFFTFVAIDDKGKPQPVKR